MNNLDQVALKLNRAAAELRENIRLCLADTDRLIALTQGKLDAEDALWLQGKRDGLNTVATLMRDDGYLCSNVPLEELAGKLQAGAFDRAGWKAVLGSAEDAFVDGLCDREAEVQRGLNQLAKLRGFLHGLLRSMLTGMDEGGIGF